MRAAANARRPTGVAYLLVKHAVFLCDCADPSASTVDQTAVLLRVARTLASSWQTLERRRADEVLVPVERWFECGLETIMPSPPK